ncbi:ABC transporter ATP-binding protein [Myroides odoratimimus]|uniref:ABC transporter ATP-binding protein n=1 Tax=Myroides odoratimimus TaxID=76832 RepID=UPI00091805FB|nr:ABC transporter ATP-binding protein [Myroides odoratimimus]SHL57490.1 ATP-binding cassette, subfamily B [Myroides odoratimimus subsp. xuanwuensis]
MIKNIKYVTSLNKKDTQKTIFWQLVQSAFTSAPTVVLLIIVWELFEIKPNKTLIWTVLGIMLLMMILQYIVSSKVMVSTNIWVYNLSNKLRINMGNRMQKFSLGFFKQKDPGEITSVVLQDVANFEIIFGHSIGNIASGVFGTLLLSGVLFYYDWRLTLCLLAVIPLVIPFLKIANYIIAKTGKKLVSARNGVGAKFLEYVQGIRHLKSYGQTGDKHKGLEDSFKHLKRLSIKMESLPGPLVITVTIVFEVGFILMVALGLYYLMNQSITIPVLVTFLILGYALYTPLKVIMVDYLSLSSMNESLNRVVDVLQTPIMEAGKELKPNTYDITFDQVSFGYLKDQITIDNLSFKVPQHSMLALVGHSGSGKTTIASLIARFWDVNQGVIKIGGIDIRNINTDYFYSLISEVFQDVYLFDDTIYNNIKMNNDNVFEKDVLDAATKAMVMEFVQDLPLGLDTVVGEGGNKLSGGQKQRISIARALLRKAPIVLLDEATASLDPENEIYIQQAIQELVKTKTVIVIAHKLATIQNADQIIVLEKGQILEQGTHSSLLDKKGKYFNMCQIQQKAGGWKITH